MQGRRTKQKQVVSRVIREANRPLTIQEVLDYGKAHLPNLGVATVYREINRLCELEELKTVNIPGDPLRYEILKHHHHHFKCNGCNKVYEIEGCIKEIKNLIPKGFKSINHEITFYGSCQACA
jgi:Fur family ferric uptake transcriptional regulator